MVNYSQFAKLTVHIENYNSAVLKNKGFKYLYCFDPKHIKEIILLDRLDEADYRLKDCADPKKLDMWTKEPLSEDSRN